MEMSPVTTTDIANTNIDFNGTRVGGGLQGGSGSLDMSIDEGEIDAQLKTGGEVSVKAHWKCDWVGPQPVRGHAENRSRLLQHLLS